jgi:hypothetical protein
MYLILYYMTLELKKFDMKRITFLKDENKGPVIVLIGRRDTGKSYLVRDLLYHHRDIPIGTVISGTEAGNGFYASHIPKLFIHDEYSSGIIENILKRQKSVMKEVNKQIQMYKSSKIDPRTFVILDDCLYDNTWAKDKLMRLLFMNGRHWKVLLILTMQYPLGILPNLRTNIDYVFILREPYIANRKRIYENYAGMFPTFESFCQVMDQCTENYECLVIDNNVKSNKLSEQIFWYKADTSVNYKLCSQELWHMQNTHDEKEALGLTTPPDDEENYNPTSFEVKKNKPKIRVVRKTG